MSTFSVEAPRWRHVQDAVVSGVPVPDAAWPLPPQQLRLSICKCTSLLLLLVFVLRSLLVFSDGFSCISGWGAAWAPDLPMFRSCFRLHWKFMHPSYYLYSLVSSPNIEHMVFLCFERSLFECDELFNKFNTGAERQKHTLRHGNVGGCWPVVFFISWLKQIDPQ